MFGPRPATEQGRDVILADLVLRVVDGSWDVPEGPQLAEKIQIGPVTHADLDPAYSSHVITSFAGGYGLRRFSDHPDRDVAALMFLEASNVDTRYPDWTLAQLQTLETLPGATAPAVWVGEFEPNTGVGVRLVAVAGTKVFYRTTPGTWVDTGIVLPAAARRGAVGVFNKNLVIGFGASAPAVRTINLTSTATVTDGAASTYVWAFTADRAAAYVAGGPTVNDFYTVRSSADGVAYTTPTVCGTSDTVITALAPGGGVNIVMVGKEEELGALGPDGIYRRLVPLDSRSSTNCLPMRWELGAGGDEQRGPLTVFFKRERSLYTYQPQTDTSGQAANVSPWAEPSVRPLNARGDIRALQGSARWLYTAIRNGTSNNTWIAARDARNGRWHLPCDLGVNDCQAMTITSLFGTNPLLIVGKGNDMASIIMPLDGDAPVSDAACRFAASGWLLLSSIDLGFPDEQKILFSIKLTGEQFVANEQEIAVYASYDDGPWDFLGRTSDDEECIINLSPTQTLKRVDFRLDFSTTDPTLTPILHSISVRLSLNVEPRRLWHFDAFVPGGERAYGGPDLSNAKATIDALWAARKAGSPIDFRDLWGSNWVVRLMPPLRERQVMRTADGVPETVLSLALLEVSEGSTTSVAISWSSPPASGLFIPIEFDV